ncbi:gfi-2 [Pristionchus pacificus]|uniref:Gfi-2 n=1 Tax=Pristionchus pacificus TaxID=54126 RepID=A0A2A6CIY6_PRIPA|nr:gfi-2 [Pristionchus pacificus]|eukprot:PDM78013.1 gfi-2 [Pristionchus pacificus]
MAMIDHSQLAAELPDIEKMNTQERIQLAKTRRANQLRVNAEYQRTAPPPRPRKPRLRFSAEIELLDATSRNDIHEVGRLLDLGADPNSHNEDGLTPLHQCAIDDNVDIMTLLISRGANVNARDTECWTPLHAAACCAHINVVHILIESGANLLAVNADGNMPYDICDDDRTLDVIENRMAEKGITQQSIDEERGSAEKDMLSDMKLMHQRGIPLDSRMADGSTYLHIAAANGFYDVAAFLLRNRLDPNTRDNDLWTSVHAAAAWAQPDLLELLCDYGGEINAKTSNMEAPIDLCEEDVTTRAVITQLQNVEAKKRKPGGFGVRDSRRQSRRRKKFESPGQSVVAEKNGFSARGAIRRQSLRDKTGLTPARLEAQAEKTDLMRSWSREDLSTGHPSTSQPIISTPVRETSPNKRVLRGAASKTKPMSPDEWLRKLERGGEEEEESTPTRGSQRWDSKKNSISNGSPNRRKKTCCCVIC